MNVRRLLDALRAHESWTLAGIVLYMVVTIPTHDRVQDLFFAYRDLVGLTWYHRSILLVGTAVALALAWPVVRPGSAGRRLWRWWAWTAFLLVGCFLLLMSVSSEMVHYFQYAIVAVPLYALTRSSLDTLVLGTLLGAIDEAYQYLVLHTFWGTYLDFNDILINAAGVALGLLWVLSATGLAAERRAGVGGAWRAITTSPAARGAAVIIGLFLVCLPAGITAGTANWDAPGVWLSMSRIDLAPAFWTFDEGNAKAFHILRPIEGTLLILLAIASFAALDAEPASRPPTDAGPRRRVAMLVVILTLGAAIAFPAAGRRNIARAAAAVETSGAALDLPDRPSQGPGAWASLTTPGRNHRS